jgi:hypothetical protein
MRQESCAWSQVEGRPPRSRGVSLAEEPWYKVRGQNFATNLFSLVGLIESEYE